MPTLPPVRGALLPDRPTSHGASKRRPDRLTLCPLGPFPFGMDTVEMRKGIGHGRTCASGERPETGWPADMQV